MPSPQDLGFPFSRDEIAAAQALVRPRDEAERYADRMFDLPDDAIGFIIGEGELYLLALVSEDLHRRVLAYRPDLAPMIARIMADREGYLAARHEVAE
ncbi:MAG TPA: hypothetical protein VF263_26545 [Longimicrobiaceae bacterium]